ncbi:uncharacterized protein ATNIH1004_005191 [Aspergillus tanneri]|uniref:Uncharacterized protein n=1 Tax=Aspergillus tanneri TaxID=1220188 RepID=A0A5M9MVD0_9EURO|nr:uncharacterized protein ATNIH1004_005191 [Aspergillus tanneri]KAA8649290.1 hypothetical protein ATNIH1004_005191 [Aspergillus tanneri]
MAFLTYDEEHHRIAITGLLGTTDKDPDSCGLEHIAFTYGSSDGLFLSYHQHKALGMNLANPDGNKLESQSDNFDAAEGAPAFMGPDLFASSPIGTEIDPEDIIKRIESGEDYKST